VQLTQKQWAEARRLREAKGLTFADIAARIGVHVATVRKRAAKDQWVKGAAGAAAAAPAKPRRAPSAMSIAGRRQLIRRLYQAMDTKLKLMERRMEKQIAQLDQNEDLPSADHERDTRAFGIIIRNIAHVKEMQADLDRVAGGRSATASAGDAELFAEAERFRKEIAERLARFIPPAG
jgi:transcriptional regulator with XRE-family HTH domain